MSSPKTPFFSILIPTYKTNKNFIFQCLDSIFKQDYKDFEIIICQQGDEDLSFLETKYPSIKKIKLKVPSSYISRIELYKNATGKYVWYVDADDFLFNGALKQMADVILSTNFLDLYIFDFEKVKMNTIYDAFQHVCKNYSSLEIIAKNECEKLLFERSIPNNVWVKCFKRDVNPEFLDTDIFFADDVLISDAIIKKSETICLFNSHFYAYRTNEDSGTHKLSINYINDELKVFHLIVMSNPNKNLCTNFLVVSKQVASMIYYYFIKKVFTYKKFKSFKKNSDFIFFLNFRNKHRKEIKTSVFYKKYKKYYSTINFVSNAPFALLSIVFFLISKLKRK